jgi:hypothetical protein
VISQFSEKKLNFFFSFLSCSVHWGLEFQEAFLRETVDLLAFFPLGSAAQMGERVRAFDLDPMDGSPSPTPTLADPLSSQLWQPPRPPPPPFPPLWPPPPPPSLFVSSPWAAALYPLHGFLLPLDLPHTARIEKRRSTLN